MIDYLSTLAGGYDAPGSSSQKKFLRRSLPGGPDFSSINSVEASDGDN